MTHRAISGAVLRLAIVAVALTILPAAMAGPKYKVLHAFGFGKDAGGLLSNLTFDKKGNLYGTTSGGGAHNEGIVFELSPSAGGSWKENVLHSFYYRNDGNFPYGGLIFDEQGNLYGTLSTGGPHQAGTVFKLTPTSNGWTETLLHSFCSAQRCTDGSGPFSGLILDPAGDLYGATFGGGRYGDGALFKLSPGSRGWTENVLYNFCAQLHCADGDGPYAGLTWDAVGNLYGTTEFGGKDSPDYGTAFELKHNPDGTRQYILLHSFPSFPGDGEVVYAGLVFDTSGNLYGATNSGGGHLCGQTLTCGTVFELSLNPNGRWKETILYRFPNPSDGVFSRRQPGV